MYAAGSNGSATSRSSRRDDGIPANPAPHPVRIAARREVLLEHRRQHLQRRDGVGVDERLGHARRLVPRAVRVDQHLPLGGREPRAQRLRRRRVAHPQHHVRRIENALGAQQRVVVRDHSRTIMRPGPHPRRRVCEHRPLGQRGDARHGLCDRIGGRPGDDRSARRGVHQLSQLLDERAVRHGIRLLDAHPRRPVGTALPVGGVQTGIHHRRQRLAQRQIQMHGAGPPAERRRVRAAGQRAVVHGRVAPGRVVAHLDEPLRERPVQLDLVDRLPGADVAQLGRPVGRQHDQRHARLVRLDDSGHQVRGGAAGRAGDGDRPARRLRQPEGDEPGRALVEDRHRLESRIARERQDDRRVARSRRRDRMRHPAAHELVDHHDERGERRVHRVQHAQETTNVAFVPGFMQRAEAWAPVAERVLERGWPISYGRGRGVVVGYSHGGRVAIQEAVRGPQRCAGLVLVSATPGIEDDAVRAQRLAEDKELAAWIETHSIEQVVARWERLPVFATQSPELVEAQRPGRLSHDPKQLAQQLRATGQGVFEPVWHRLADLPIPVLAIAGELDDRYAIIARRMAEALPNGRAAIVAGAGHAPQLEQPDTVTGLLLEFLDEHFGEGVVGDGDAEAGTLRDG